VTYPGHEPTVVTHNGRSILRKKKYSGVGLSVVTALTSYRSQRPPYMVSTITLIVTREVSLRGTKVKCSVDILPNKPYNVHEVVIQYRTLDQGKICMMCMKD
jgi:hypothetical protein